jgi:hypothetical protein
MGSEFDNCGEEVVDAFEVLAGESMVVHSVRYDRLTSLIFPEYNGIPINTGNSKPRLAKIVVHHIPSACATMVPVSRRLHGFISTTKSRWIEEIVAYMSDVK